MIVTPLPTVREVTSGCDLAALLVSALDAAGVKPHRRSILVVTQKIVSKALGLVVDLRDVKPSPEAYDLANRTGKDPRFVEVVLRESTAVVRAAPNVLISRHRSGHVMANSGLDQSNLGLADADSVLLLPADPDGETLALRRRLTVLLGDNTPGVILSDSFGRPWRQGVTNVAIGAAGVPSLIDRRGDTDRDGRVLRVTQTGFADMVACAAGLVMGEAAEGIPAAVVSDLDFPEDDSPAADLIRPIAEDLFR